MVEVRQVGRVGLARSLVWLGLTGLWSLVDCSGRSMYLSGSFDCKYLAVPKYFTFTVSHILT